MKHLIANLIRWAAYKLHGWAERVSPEEKGAWGHLIGTANGWMESPMVGGYVYGNPDGSWTHVNDDGTSSTYIAWQPADDYKVGGTD